MLSRIRTVVFHKKVGHGRNQLTDRGFIFSGQDKKKGELERKIADYGVFVTFAVLFAWITIFSFFFGNAHEVIFLDQQV